MLPSELEAVLGRLSEDLLVSVGKAWRKQTYGHDGLGISLGRTRKADKVTWLGRLANTSERRQTLADLALAALRGEWKPPQHEQDAPHDNKEHDPVDIPGQATPEDDLLADRDDGGDENEAWADAVEHGDQTPDGEAGQGAPQGPGADEQEDQQAQAEAEADAAAEEAEQQTGPLLAEAIRKIAHALDVHERRNYPTTFDGAVIGEPDAAGVRPVIPVNVPKLKGGGYHPVMPKVLALVNLPPQERVNILLVGPAGSGKSTVCRQVAKLLNVPFGEASCTAGMGESVLTGYLLPGDGMRATYYGVPFTERYEHGGVFCLDEVDAMDANTGLILNSATSNGGMTIAQRQAGGLNPHLKRHENFVLIACANTFGTGADAQYVGRTQLDAAFLDRYVILEMDYDQNLNRRIMGLAEKPVKGWTATPAPERLAGDLSHLGSWLDLVQGKVSKAGMLRVIGTRARLRARAMRIAGFGIREIQEVILAGWAQDDLATLGDLAPGKAPANA